MGHSYVSLLSYPRVLAVLPISQGPPICVYIFIPEGIGGATNTEGGGGEGAFTYVYFHSQGVFAVPPVPRGPSNLLFVAYSTLSRNDHKY